ncbi:Fusarisetin A cluster transcription factor fsa6 [Podospora australis]|uniref:Fusarisetin A cluster transcription factor fsa6 n=1 Tax=Podospora australis TaxID=1536484 RepID=A0AAN6X016_9PEZI|nr:Fusarisetin A cluster transcription factor fsa6 [Podospora australis]
MPPPPPRPRPTTTISPSNTNGQNARRSLLPMPPTPSPHPITPVGGGGPSPLMSALAAAAAGRPLPPGQKRTRVLLSCGPCRMSKQKCDRQQPCKNCTKKSREDLCEYAPKPDKTKPERSMAARLKRLEGMVREMMHNGQPLPPSMGGPPAAAVPSTIAQTVETDNSPHAQVVMGKEGTGSMTYVGATHFMAMLDDIEDLKSYFDDDDEEPNTADVKDSSFASPEAHSPEMMLLSGTVPTCKQDLIDLLPPRHVVDRLVQRYFSAASPSHHCVHRPTFGKQYNEFWQDPEKTHIQWISLLLIIVAMGTLLSIFTAPHELAQDSDVPPMERFRIYRAAALWALVAGKFSTPSILTLQPFLLYIESEFLINKTSQMNCYLLISVCIRMMLRMGLHRDPSKLPNITPFEGEMRRRMWHLAAQFDHLVSFHMGLPSMVHGIESDTLLPSNYVDDEDLDENCSQLPKPRPDSEYTLLTYPTWKSAMCQVFGLVAHQANSLTTPTYAQVLELDRRIEETWARVPSFMKTRKIPDNTVTDTPAMINQRFGLVSLYHKSRCVLHRRYLIEPIPKPEHAYSRRTCLEAAVELLEYQHFMHLATLPGGALRPSGWFITALAIHDFLIAAMIIYLVLQKDTESDDGEESDWINLDPGSPLPSREQLHGMLVRSHSIWVTISQNDPAYKKATDTLRMILKKLESKRGAGPQDPPTSPGSREEDSWHHMSQSHSQSQEPVSVRSLSMSDEQWDSELVGSEEPPIVDAQMPFSRTDLIPAQIPNPVSLEPWLELGMEQDQMISWDTFDSAMNSDNILYQQQMVEAWIPEGPLLDDVQLMATLGFQGPFSS